MDKQIDFVQWFRDSAPYIHAHRHRTFVISFGGEAVLDSAFDHLVHDFALLSSLGIRLALVHGIRPQIDRRLQQMKATAQFHNNLRITDDLALQCVKDAAGSVRVEIEALLSMGLANTPMSGSGLKVVSGNYITAKPIGVLDGVDYQHTGEVRRIDSLALAQHLAQHSIVLLSPVGYSPSGEVFNLSAEQVAMSVAIALKAEKLILLTERPFQDPETGDQIQQITATEADALLHRYPGHVDNTMRLSLQAAIQSCRHGVNRVHLLDRRIDGALLLELFTHNGIGTLISSTPYEEIRSATLNDIGGILELIKPLEAKGILASRTREKIEMEIADYVVIELDGLIIGCTALHTFEHCKSGVVACLAVHPDYQNGKRGMRLLDRILSKARQQQLNKLFVFSTQTTHWFVERGFCPFEAVSQIPEPLNKHYNPQRNSKVLVRDIQ